ncbi:D-threo-aldose 1-dehydrogenase [Rhizobium sp. SG_E_25_P2]|uniref:aldo/keto reductase n=1 Tax=Rhizobium sp. SG_E_25_P2 TaxID=2879942 RepID=UPI00247368DE|nr:aldo/keto reductase [Rhizobium sp. SG_E_25_P2]MDH6268727.1 D-threo-aldose 1-dehydrogenase [Rhizobium sp. SG_E_25_P2]
MKTRRVAKTSLEISEIGFGCAPLAGLYRPCSEEQARDVLQTAWDAGIRYFDTAPHYGAGLSEERLGKFLADKARSDVVISTKVGRLFTPVPRNEAPDYGFVDANPAVMRYDYSRDGIMRSLEESSKRMGVDRFDIVFVHDIGPYTHKEPDNSRHLRDLRQSGGAALEELKARGVIGAWGVGVNETAVCMDLMGDFDMDVILLAGRYTLLDRTAERDLLPLCRKRGISLVIGGVFNSGILATGPLPGATFDYAPASADIQARVGGMKLEAEQQGHDLAALALQFPLADSCVASVLIGTAKSSSLIRNLQSVEHRIDPGVYGRFERFSLGAN